jgi:hypothetical protein
MASCNMSQQQQTLQLQQQIAQAEAAIAALQASQ